MTYQIDTQSLMALTEQELLGLYETLSAELKNLQCDSDAYAATSELINRILNVIHHNRRQQRPRPTAPRF